MTKCPGDAEWLRLTGSNYYIRCFVQHRSQGIQRVGNKYNWSDVLQQTALWWIMLPWWWQQEWREVTSYMAVCGEKGESRHECWRLPGTVQRFPSLHWDLQSCYTRTVRAFNAFNQCDERGVLTHCSAVISTGGVQTVQDLFWWHARCMLRVVQCPSDRYLCTAEANKCSQNMRRAPCSSDTKMQPCLSCRVGWIRFSNGWICLWWKQLCLCGQT